MTKHEIETIMMTSIVEGIASKYPDAGLPSAIMNDIYRGIYKHLKLMRLLFCEHPMGDLDDICSSICFPLGCALGEMINMNILEFVPNHLTMWSIIMHVASSNYFNIDDGDGNHPAILEILEREI